MPELIRYFCLVEISVSDIQEILFLPLVKTMSIEWLFKYSVLGIKVEVKLETIKLQMQ